MDWVAGKIRKGVVHPAHVPFAAETDSSEIGRTGNAWPGGRFFGVSLNIGIASIDFGVEAFEKFDRFQIFASAKFVWDPFALFSRIIEIKHRGDGVDAQAVDMIFIEPKEGAADQKRADLVATVVENVAFPVRVKSLARIGMFEKVGAVKIGEAMFIAWKMGRNPVEDDADPVLVQVIDQVHEILRRSVATGRGKIAGSLVAP